ncbi:Os09g0105200 [Oryza sativa Japonica Group]|uniref:Os09g0105200 protein n=1 Tax=Oryza sativa subsp. japonica TaxID=39947 RepID=A0A0N7KQC0_ORYSJ|nr:Os09g0105200 [Oryza sativa Japonica Group]
MWIIYAISSVLAPTTATTVSPRCYPSVVDAGNIKNLNSCKFVISTLQKATKAGKNTNSACLLYMMLKSSFQHEGTNLFGSNVDFSTFINSNVPNTMQEQENDRIVTSVQNLCEGFSDFVADEEEVEDTEEDEYIDEDGDSDDDEDEGEEDDDDEGEEDDDEHRSENDDNDGAETGRSGEQADAATDVTCCKGDDTNEGIGSGGKGADDVTGCNGDDTNEGIASGGKGADDVIGKGKQVDEGIGFGDKDKHEEKQAPNAAAQNVPESEKQPVQKAEKYPFLTTTIDSHEVPNFNLGFDSSQEVVQTPKGQEATGTSRGKEFPRIITNEDYGSFTTEDYEKVGREADEAIASKSATKSPVAEVISKEPIADDCEVEEEIPVPHEVVKPAKFKRSPFIDYENKKQFVVSRVINEGYLLDLQLDRNELKKHFDQTRANRLDHKELELGNGNDKDGHYFVVCLNLKAERFEVYDSLRGEDDEELISASNLVVVSIKTM